MILAYEPVEPDQNESTLATQENGSEAFNELSRSAEQDRTFPGNSLAELNNEKGFTQLSSPRKATWENIETWFFS